MVLRLFLLLLLSAPPALALEGRVFLPDGEPAAGSQISVVGRSKSTRAGAEGEFRLDPDPRFPATLIVIGPRGEVYPPVHVASAPAAGILIVNLEAAFRESVTVVSGVAPNIEASPTAATGVAGQEDLDERQPQHLADVVEGFAGIGRTEASAAAVPVIRGLSGGRTLLLVDGARITTERRAGASGSFVDPFSLGSVEISRGPGSVAYGSDAFGGVIHATPRDPVPGDPAVRYSVRGSAGGSPGVAVAAETSFDLGPGAMLILLRGRRGGDQKDGAGADVVNSSYGDAGATLRWIRDLGSGRIRGGLTVDRADQIERPSIDADRVRASYPREASDRLTLGFDGAIPARGWSSFEARAFFGRNRLVTDRLTVASGEIERSDVEALDASFRVTAARPWEDGALQIGAELVSRFDLSAVSSTIRTGSRVEELSIDDADRHDLGAFATWDAPLAKDWSAALGLRGDWIRSSNQGGHFGDLSRTSLALSGHAALTRRWSESVVSSVQVSRGFREPMLSDRYFRGTTARGFITGNPELESETSLQWDGSIRWTGRRATLAMFAYAYAIQDLVERFRSGSEFAFRNRGEARLRGVELEGALPLRGGFEAQLAASWSEGDRSGGQPIDEILPPTAQGTLRWAGAHGFAFVRARAWSRHDDPGPLERVRPGAASLDASAGRRWGSHLEVILAVDNLLDRRWFASPDESAVLAPGRTITLALVGRIDR